MYFYFKILYLNKYYSHYGYKYKIHNLQHCLLTIKNKEYQNKARLKLKFSLYKKQRIRQ